MVNNNSSGTTKRRKKRKSITYDGAKQRKKVNSTHGSEKSFESVGDKYATNSTDVVVAHVASMDKSVNDRKDRSHRTNSDSSVSKRGPFETEQVDSVRSNSLSTLNSVNIEICNSVSTASTSKAPAPENNENNSPVEKRLRKSRPRKQKYNETSGNNQIASSPKKRKMSQDDDASDKVEISLNSSKSGTRKRKSITFMTAREKKKMRDSRRQLADNPISPKKSNAKVRKKTTTTVQKDESRNHSSSDSAPGKNSPRKRGQTSSSSLTLKNSKKAKTTRKDDQQSSSESSMTRTTTGHARVNTRSRKSSRTPQENPAIPDRISDLVVTNKAFRKWKPLAKSTMEFVEQTLQSVVLNTIAQTNAQENQKALKCLTILKERVLEKLPYLKAPYTQGDYRKMESQNKESEEMLVEKSRELNALEEKIKEEERLLEVESAMAEEYKNKLELCKKELASLENEKMHPLIRGTENVLDLPELPEELLNDSKEVSLEADSAEEIHLAQTLSKLREKTGGWMDKLSRLEKLAEYLGQN